MNNHELQKRTKNNKKQNKKQKELNKKKALIGKQNESNKERKTK